MKPHFMRLPSARGHHSPSLCGRSAGAPGPHPRSAGPLQPVAAHPAWPPPHTAGINGVDATRRGGGCRCPGRGAACRRRKPSVQTGKPWQQRRKGPGGARKGLAGPARSQGPAADHEAVGGAHSAVDHRHAPLAGRVDGHLHAGLVLEGIHREHRAAEASLGAAIVQPRRQHAHAARAVAPVLAAEIAGGESARVSGAQQGADGAVHGVVSSRGRVDFAAPDEPLRGKNVICRAWRPANHD